MKKSSRIMLLLALALSIVVIAVGCRDEQAAQLSEDDLSLEGTYVGRSWRGQTEGVDEFDEDEVDRYIETILTLDEDGIIEDAQMRFFVQNDGYWARRDDGSADISVDFDVEPTMASFNNAGEYELGNSMFDVSTTDMMALYAVAVDEDTGDVAALLVDPWYRFVHELRLDADFDFENATIGEDLNYASGNFFATTRAARENEIDWEEQYGDNTIFDFNQWNHVITARGPFEGMDENTSVKDFLAAMGVEFANGQPQPMDVEYGRHSNGGWPGTMEAIADYLIGQDATEVTNLYDEDAVLFGQTEPLSAAINEDNIFGADVPSGATQNVQDSFDGVAGATVRISREATSYQRALEAAGILDEDEVIVTDRI
ncbi:hypothetical protein MWH28_07555 [Natroniella sulfidigena]|uniref:hypothetical protein n=1 Tax=Natroniella sulfidigena TaxID=723921 RepID=UPI00200A2988|nr:hypothetical protein [Natroniella sulfidigena]MCK8817214.1 hypothetical protein [Natroniella sulfidigena]